MLPDGNGGLYCQGGLSIRDWFAGMALQAELSKINVYWREDSLAEYAYEMADAMLAAREGKEEGQ